jgi:hypothetical protein
VLYGLYALRVAVNTGRCAVGSQARTPRWRSLSSLGGLSIEYEIHACLTGYSVRECVLALSFLSQKCRERKSLTSLALFVICQDVSKHIS